jgi:hypothetical protein
LDAPSSLFFDRLENASWVEACIRARIYSCRKAFEINPALAAASTRTHEKDFFRKLLSRRKVATTVNKFEEPDAGDRPGY